MRVNQSIIIMSVVSGVVDATSALSVASSVSVDYHDSRVEILGCRTDVFPLGRPDSFRNYVFIMN